jgi:DNA-binding FadR family transcriptional regulator
MAETKNMQNILVHSLKQDIITGRYKEGEYLPSPSALAEKFGVGQTVVREAISALKATGYVDVKRGRNGGVLVADQSLEILTDRLMEYMLTGRVVFEQAAQLRLLLEIEGCRAGTPTVDENTVTRLREIDERMLAAASFDEHTELNTDFHLTIGLMGGNALQGIFLKLLLHFVGRAAELVSPDYRGMHSDDEHKPIIQAIADRNTEQACHFLQEHIEKANQRVSRLEKEFFARATQESVLSGLRKTTT